MTRIARKPKGNEANRASGRLGVDGILDEVEQKLLDQIAVAESRALLALDGHIHPVPSPARLPDCPNQVEERLETTLTPARTTENRVRKTLLLVRFHVMELAVLEKQFPIIS